MKSFLSFFFIFALTTSFAQNVQWHKMCYPLNYTPTDIKKAGDMLYMTTLENTYLASQDNGDTWKIVADWKFGMLPRTTGAAQFIDENNNIIMYPGMSSYPSSLRQSKDNANTWKSLNVLQRSNILSITNWKAGFIYISSEYNDNIGRICTIDTIKKIDNYYENELFGKCFTLDSVYFINYSGIYSSPFDTIIPKKIIHFPTQTKSFSLYMNDKSCFVSAENFLFFTHDNGRTWEKDTLPFIAKHLQKNSQNFYAIDNDNLLWKLTSDGRQWAKFLSFPIAHDSITCFYADDENLFFGGSKGLLRYSLQNSTWLNNIDVGSISSYTVKLTERGICVSTDNLWVLPSGFCYTTNLGESWKKHIIENWGDRVAKVTSRINYFDGNFWTPDAGGYAGIHFSFFDNRLSTHYEPEGFNVFYSNGNCIIIHRNVDSVTIKKNTEKIKFKLELPEPIKYSFDNRPLISFFIVQDTIYCSYNDSIYRRSVYFSSDYCKTWTKFTQTIDEKEPTPFKFGQFLLRINTPQIIEIYNALSDSWYTINDSRWGTTKYSDMDYNDSLIVVGHTTGVYYLTPDDIPALTSLQETPLEQSVNIYPMPFEDILTLTLPTQKANITIYSLMGIPLLSTHIEHSNTCTLNTEHLPKGVYYIQIETNYSTIRQSIIKP